MAVAGAQAVMDPVAQPPARCAGQQRLGQGENGQRGDAQQP